MEKEKEKKKYPIGAEHYTLYEEVGTGVSASVHRALCIPLNEVVAIKILDFERNNSDLNNISREAQTMVLVDHPNVLKSHCSFVSDHNLWVIMPYMAGGSCLHILKAAHPDGFEEVVIATILREVLKGLDYLHQHGHIHRDVKAGNVLIDSRGAIKLGDFGVSACLFDCGDRQRMRNTFVGTPCWMAPEVMEQLHGYDFKADIWSFGITALELAHGHAPFSKYPPMKVLLMTLQNAPPGLDYERDKKFSKSFKQMIASCLVKDPVKRPSARKLLKHSFFKQARSNDYISRTLLEGLPALGDRLKALKRKEEDMLAQKKMPDGEKEELSQNEYKRGISSWNFDLDDLKAQASMIPDDESVSEKDEDMQTKALSRQASLSRSKLQHQCSFKSHCSDASDDNAPAYVPSADLIAKLSKYEKSDDDLSILGSTIEQPRTYIHVGDENLAESLTKRLASELSKRSSEDGASTSSNQSDKVNSHSCSYDGIMSLQTLDHSQPETMPKGSKTSVNGDEVDDKAKNPVVQQKGRFKVTSENFETEKVIPLVSTNITKSQSLQIITPSSPAIFPPMHCDTTISNLSGQILPGIQTVLQTNIQQRDTLLNLMKQLATGDLSATVSTPMSITVSDVNLMETANEREKELLREITDLQWRLVSANEELQKYKAENARPNS